MSTFPLPNSAQPKLRYTGFSLGESNAVDTKTNVTENGTVAEEQMKAEGAIASASRTIKKSSILELSPEELEQKHQEIEDALSKMDLQSMSNPEKYKAINALFTSTFGDDFHTVMHIQGADGTTWEKGARQLYAFNPYIRVLQAHILYNRAEISNSELRDDYMREISIYAREAVYPGKSTEEIQDIIAAKYPPVGKMTNRDFILMMSEMHEMGVDDGTYLPNYGGELTFRIQTTGRPPYADMEWDDAYEAILSCPFSPAFYGSTFTTVAELERGRLGKEGLDFAVKYLGCMLEAGYFKMLSGDEYMEVLNGYIDSISK